MGVHPTGLLLVFSRLDYLDQGGQSQSLCILHKHNLRVLFSIHVSHMEKATVHEENNKGPAFS